MPKISTARLDIIPTHQNCWSIFDQFDNQLIGKMYFRQQWFNIILKPQSLCLGVATEASFGLMKALNNSQYKARTELDHAQKFLLQLGFKSSGNHFSVSQKDLTYPNLYQNINLDLAIDTSQSNTPLQRTAAQLIDSDIDCFERPTKLHPQANQAWQIMKTTAAKEGVTLKLVSAFRSMRYQAGLIQRKINNAESLAQILKTNTAPGHSEHHTGCAIDITTTEYQPLENEFDKSTAFTWLTENADKYGFSMTYPENNNHGIIYEPWHWCYHHNQ